MRCDLPYRRRSTLIEPDDSLTRSPSVRLLRLVPDGTAIQFMRGRFAGVIVSAILSTLSVFLVFYPGLNLGVDFRGGIAVELRGSQPLQTDVIRQAFAPFDSGDIRV